jgi:hypothetical protein
MPEPQPTEIRPAEDVQAEQPTEVVRPADDASPVRDGS